MNNVTQSSPKQSTPVVQKSQEICRDILTAPTAPNPALARERPPRDPNFVLYLLRKGYPLEAALRIERKITRELSADAGADMGGKADV